MLHVTNGDVAAGLLRDSGLPGEVLPWRDVLHEGPVPAGLPLAELSAMRAGFIASGGRGEEGEVARSFAERDRAIRAFRDHEEVVIWLEHDLYDQLQMVQLLAFFAGEDRGTTRLSLVCGEEYLGLSRPERLAERFGERREVGGAELALGRAAWEAFTCPDPRAVEAVVAGGTATLPWLGPALRRWLEQLPWTRDGLSRSERQALAAIAGGAATVEEAFLATREEPAWLGDTTFAGYLAELSAGEHPLVLFDDGSRISAGAADIFARRVALTGAGRAVLDGREDRIRLNGIDRWWGGVHLRGREVPWRWDAEAGRIASGAGRAPR